MKFSSSSLKLCNEDFYLTVSLQNTKHRSSKSSRAEAATFDKLYGTHFEESKAVTKNVKKMTSKETFGGKVFLNASTFNIISSE